MSVEQTLITTEAGREMPPAEVKVWDPLVRLFHWSLAGLVLFAFISGEDWGGSAHVNAGYAVLALIGVRIVWGFIGAKQRASAISFAAPKRLRPTWAIFCAFSRNAASGTIPLAGR